MQRIVYIVLLAVLQLAGVAAVAQTDTAKAAAPIKVKSAVVQPNSVPVGGGGITASIDITTPYQVVCSGSAVTFSIMSRTNPGTSPTYMWFLNGQPTGQQGFNYTINNITSDASVYCMMTSSDTRVTNNPVSSAPVDITVVPLSTPSIWVSASATSTCSGTPITFTTDENNGGSSPAYQWLVNGGNVAGATGSSFTTNSLTDGQTVSCMLTSNASCLTTNTNTSSPIAITIVPTAGTPSAPTGNTTICQGGTTTYTTFATNANSYNWTITGGTVSGTGNTVSVTWPSNLSGPAQISVSANGCGTSATASTAVSITPTVTAPAQPTGPTTFCQGSAPTTYATGSVANATGYVWSVTPSDAGAVSGTGTTAVVTWNSSFSGSATVGVYATGCNASATPATLPLTVTPTVGVPSAPSGSVTTNSGNGPVTYTTSASNATGYIWSISPADAGTITSNGTSASISWDLSYTGNAVVNVQAAGCNGPSAAATSSVLVYAPLNGGLVVPASLTITTGSNPGVLTAGTATGGNSSNAAYVYQWQESTDGNSYSSTGSSTQNYSPGTLYGTTYFRRMTVCGGDTAYSNVSVITVQGSISNSDWNYIRTRTVKKPGVFDKATADGLSDNNDVEQTTQYFDGLGRSVQTVSKQASPLGYDMVVPQVYDAFGRDAVHYLPYVSPSTDGNNKSNPLGEQSIFNTTQFPGEQFYYGRTDYEASPLNRPVANYAAGNSWAGGNKGVTTQYLVNTSIDNVQIWNIGAVAGSLPLNGGAYPAGQLYKTTTTDEQQHTVVEYKDKDGHVVLKKVQSRDVPAAGHSGWLCTYYVYDDLNNLRFVLSPKAVELISNTGWAVSQGIADELCFRYEYDGRNRMIIKKVPGAGETDMVYDVRDRLVFSQDANQREKNEWLSMQYDDLNRMVITGLMTYSSTAYALQQTVTSQTLAGGSSLSLTPTLDLFTPDESGISQASELITMDDGFSTAVDSGFLAEITNFNYTEPGYGAEGIAVNASAVPPGAIVQPLIINYYDNYDWVAGTSPGLGTTLASNHTRDGSYFITTYNAAPTYAVPVTADAGTRGQLTGTMHLVLDENRPLYAVNFYDDRARPIQSQSMNYTGAKDTVTTQYDFSGKPLRVLQAHWKGLNTVQGHSVLTKMDYDANFRLRHIWKNIDNAATDQLIDSLQYNELGQLRAKYLGHNLDSLVYDYNIRGWVNGINKNYVGGRTNNYFGMELGYDKASSIDGTTSYLTPAYNGNIAGTVWRSAGDGVNRKYDFSYDNVNRLTGAAYLDNKNGSWTHGSMDFTVSNLTYDANGNILSMSQNGFKVGSPAAPIDQLTYAYQPNSNKLRQVTDSANDPISKLGDFHYNALTKDTSDYTYDGNGNLALDKNKAIDKITYNYLNLPQWIHVNGKGTILYTYDAGGTKLKKVTMDSLSGHSTTTLYLDGFVYQQIDTINNPGGGVDTLQFAGHEEGRARWAWHSKTNTYGWEYDFYEKDHLGNTRVLLTQQKDTASYLASMEGKYRATEDHLFYNIPGTSYARASVMGYPADTSVTSPNDSVVRVNGNGPKTGPAIILKVMSGDKVDIGVNYYYNSSGATNGQTLSASDILTSLATGIVSMTGATHGSFSDLTGVGSPLPSGLTSFLNSKNTNATGKPNAYLNWIYLDNQLHYDSTSQLSGALQVGAYGTQPNGTLQFPLAQTGIPITKSGYLYIYVSNATPGWDVFFDNLSVTQYSGPMLEENHYYPFGLTMAGISDKALKSNYAINKYRYNGKELQNQEFSDGTGLEEYDFGARFQDPQLGRFFNQDRFCEKLYSLSPYQFAANDPLLFVDNNGDSLVVADLSKDNVATEKFKKLSDKSLGGYYTTKVDKDGNVTLEKTDKKGEMTKEQKAYYDNLSGIVDPNKGTVTVGLVQGSNDVLVGSYKLQEIDVDDVEKFEGQIGVTAGGVMIHELVEQQAKQLGGKAAGYEKDHEAGIQAENKVNNSVRGEQTGSVRQDIKGVTGTIGINYSQNGNNVKVTLNVVNGNVTSVTSKIENPKKK